MKIFQFMTVLAGEEIKEKAGQATDTIANAANKTKDKFNEGAHDAKDAVFNTAGKAKDKLNEGAQNVTDRIGNGK
jgi:hypothetical protein